MLFTCSLPVCVFVQFIAFLRSPGARYGKANAIFLPRYGCRCCVCVKGEVRPVCRSKLFTSAFHCIWLVFNGRQWHPGLDIRLMYGGEWDR